MEYLKWLMSQITAEGLLIGGVWGVLMGWFARGAWEDRIEEEEDEKGANRREEG